MSTPTKIEKFKDLEQDFGTTIAEALWKQAVQTMNYIEKSYPVGYVLFFHATQSNLPHLPLSTYWKELDGSVVSNANSLLNGQTLPDFRDKFFRHAKTGEIVYSAGGAATVNLQHNHGGTTGVTDPRTTFDADDGDVRSVMTPHAHIIPNASGNPGISAVSTTPRYIALKAYLRIV